LFSGDLFVHGAGELKVERGSNTRIKEDGSLVVRNKVTMNIGSN